jgi:hypothetical protein
MLDKNYPNACEITRGIIVSENDGSSRDCSRVACYLVKMHILYDHETIKQERQPGMKEK